MADGLSALYQDLLTGSYDCVDRIVLNGYFRPGHNAGGFRVWWQNLTGSVDTLDNTHLMRMAGRFSRRVRGWAKANAVPVIDCRAGERKHDLAEEHLPTTPITRGVFLILVRKAQAPVWEVSVSGKQHHLDRKKPMPYVNHYSFLVLREKAIRPLLAAAQEIRPSRGSQNPTALDRHYETVRAGMAGIFRELGVAA